MNKKNDYKQKGGIMAGTLIYKKEIISGSPAVVDNVNAGDMRPVTSNAVNGALSGLSNKYCFSGRLYNGASDNNTSYTNNILGTSSSIIVTLRWNSYLVSMVLTRKGYYHFVFDKSGVPYAALLIWNNNTITVQNRTDVYIDSVSAIISVI